MRDDSVPSIAAVSPADACSRSKLSRKSLPKVISLFSGAGGLDLGFKQAGFKILLALDISSAAIKSHKRNFPRTRSLVGDLSQLGPKGVVKLVRENIKDGESIGVIGGPPCQGFSRANVGAKSDDPRNALPALYVEIVAALQRYYSVEFIVLENVLGIRDRKHSEVYEALKVGIEKLEMTVTERELCATDFGVPQKRNRVVLTCFRSGQGYKDSEPRKRSGRITVFDAIGHLPEPSFFSRNLDQTTIPVHPNHWTMCPKSPRFKNPMKSHPDGRSFKRLHWDGPSPTIAFGHREIHVHPNGNRRLSILEAMLIQGFPSQYVLEGNLSEQVEQVSNAVPPPLAKSIARAVRLSLGK